MTPDSKLPPLLLCRLSRPRSAPHQHVLLHPHLSCLLRGVCHLETVLFLLQQLPCGFSASFSAVSQFPLLASPLPLCPLQLLVIMPLFFQAPFLFFKGRHNVKHRVLLGGGSVQRATDNRRRPHPTPPTSPARPVTAILPLTFAHSLSRRLPSGPCACFPL